MKKRQLAIKEYKNELGVHAIMIENARYHKNFSSIVEKIIKQFLNDEKLFFGFYRTDGINLTLEQEEKLKNEIPEFFKKYGDIQKINEYLTVARIDSKNYDYNIIPSIFDYYLETILFNPKVDWESFKQYYFDYQNQQFDDLILNKVADVLLCYVDSGDFGIYFNSQSYNFEEVRDIIVDAFSNV